jgi:hypothetical protein
MLLLCSIFLLPCEPANGSNSNAAAANSSAAAKAASGKSGDKQGQAAIVGSHKQGSGAQAGEEQQEFNSRLQAFRAGNIRATGSC